MSAAGNAAASRARRDRAKAASDLAHFRAESLTAKRRREIASRAGKAQSSSRKKRDRITGAVAVNQWMKVIETVDGLFDRLRVDSRPRALVFYMGDLVVMDPDGASYRLLISQHPEALVGTYNRSSDKSQVFEDIKEIRALAQAAQLAGAK